MKTPIQELLDQFDQEENGGYGYNVVIDHNFLQKEKAFAFDCFEAGRMHNHDQMICSSFQHETTFDQFYSQYAEQHTQ